MKKEKKKETIDLIDGLTVRHVAQIVRRMMTQKNHGDKKRYNRKDKSWKSEK